MIVPSDGEDHRKTIGKPEIARRIGGDIAPDHGKGTVGKVDHPHQAHGHRQANRDDEQDHPIGSASTPMLKNVCIQIMPALSNYLTRTVNDPACALFCSRQIPDPAAFQTS